MNFNYKKLKEIRIEKKISISDLVKYTGKSRRTIWNWENGKVPLDAVTAIGLSVILDVHPSEFYDVKYLPKLEGKITVENAINTLEEVTWKYGDVPGASITPIETLTNEVKSLKKENSRLNISINEILNTFNSLDFIFYLKDKDRKIIRGNNYFFNCIPSGFDAKKVIGSRSIDIFGREEVKTIIEFENNVFQYGESIFDQKINIPGSNGKKFGLLSIIPLFNNKDEVESISVVIKEMSNILYRSSKYKEFLSYFDSEDIFIWLWDNSIKKHIFFGPGVKNIVGVSSDDLLEKPDMNFLNRIVIPSCRKKLLEKDLSSEKEPYKYKIKDIYGNNKVLETFNLKVPVPVKEYYIGYSKLIKDI